MPRPKKGKRLGGSPSHQKAILSNLTQSLIWDEQITTTVAKAKMVRPICGKDHYQGPQGRPALAPSSAEGSNRSRGRDPAV